MGQLQQKITAAAQGVASKLVKADRIEIIEGDEKVFLGGVAQMLTGAVVFGVTSENGI